MKGCIRWGRKIWEQLTLFRLIRESRRKSQAFRPHNPDDWLLHQNRITYTELEEGENLKEHSPNYLKWLNHVSGGNPEKARRIKAGLYMVFGNRHDWQMFIEATGQTACHFPL
ncbi:hypothetical protein [Xenorhabdus budapestensis]|uniref:hypothetical protein n=1 Tax=Xenorhabdus budapestensis TaxID=290110 RepID=UPI001FD336B0|nr:hypothetical protein [Xenorhabdus budapestensis]